MSRNVVCYVLLALIFASCSKKISINKVDESFDEFYDLFHGDKEFQLSRVRFPLEGAYISDTGKEEWSKESWEPHLQKVTDISDPEYDTSISRKDHVVEDKVWLRDSGFSIDRRFEKIKGKWYLVYYQTVNL